jgi:hypothetical protein
MLYSRKLEQEKTEAPGEHAADTSYMYTFRQWASMKKKNYWNSLTLIFITTHDNNYRKVPLHSHQQHEHPLLVQTLSFLEWKDTNTY